MISAGAAKLKTEQNVRSLILSEVEGMIDEAILRGEFEVYFEGIISSEAEEMLEDFGYTVTRSNQHNETFTRISWKNA